MTEPRFHSAAAYGLRWRSDLPLDLFAPVEPRDGGVPDVEVSEVASLAVRESVTPVRHGHVYADGTRFPWQQEAVFETWAGRRVDYLPGPDWRGVLPSAFYGTVVAHVLAWRGMIPLHACAVEIAGKAVLIAGPGGAGKSSLMAGLLDLGAPLVSDDLTALEVRDDAIVALPGRTTIRLGRDIAQWSGGTEIIPPSPETLGKHVIRPAVRTRADRLPVAALLILGEAPGTIPALARSQALARHLFRPLWFAALPGHREQQRGLLRIASDVPVAGFAARDMTGEPAHRARAKAAWALIETLAGS